jgi:tetratricopeptide (TPR) repeat protein
MFSGNVRPSEDRLLIEEAVKTIETNEDLKSAQRLLEKALQIEPHSDALLLLGTCYLMQGDDQKALYCYNKCRSTDPSIIRAYTNACQVLENKRDYQAIEQTLTEGIEHFRKRVELYQPHHDPNVQKEYNLKAIMVYKNATESLAVLERIKKQLNTSE